jgi:hypothetical protein
MSDDKSTLELEKLVFDEGQMIRELRDEWGAVEIQCREGFVSVSNKPGPSSGRRPTHTFKADTLTIALRKAYQEHVWSNMGMENE